MLTYGIPMMIMVVSYSIMGRELWGSRPIGEQTQRQREAVQSKKKVWEHESDWIGLSTAAMLFMLEIF